MRCVPGVVAAVRAGHCGLQDASEPRASSSPHSFRAIVGDWTGAGTFFGLCCGAAYGLVVTIVGGIASIGTPEEAAIGIIAAFSVLFGSVVGIVAGIAVGVINGVELACLFRRGSLGQSQNSQRRRAALAAGLTSAVVSFALLDWALGANEARWVLVYIPTAVATLFGVVLSQALKPIRPVSGE